MRNRGDRLGDREEEECSSEEMPQGQEMFVHRETSREYVQANQDN